MNDNSVVLPEHATGAGDDAEGGRASARVDVRQLMKADEEAQNNEARVSLNPANADTSEYTKSCSRESTSSGDAHLGKRLLRVAVLALCYFLLEIVVKLVTALQFIFVAWKKRPHAGMQRLGEMIADYMKTMWLYCTFASDEAPWPFSTWPQGGAEPQG